MTAALPEAFLRLPLAHRALHDTAAGRAENGRAAVRAAVDAGYGIEIDLQPSADGDALVFHDYELDRLTGAAGPVQALSTAQARALPLLGGDGDGIPTLAEVLAIVAGQVPLLIEIKDQSHLPGGAVGRLEAATARALDGYIGPVAVMSFNPDIVAEMARLAPAIPRGLTTSAADDVDWPIDAETRARLHAMADLERVGASFISHSWTDLDRARVRDLRAAGMPVLCWTIRTPEEEAQARQFADNVTFEGYLAPKPG